MTFSREEFATQAGGGGTTVLLAAGLVTDGNSTQYTGYATVSYFGWSPYAGTSTSTLTDGKVLASAYDIYVNAGFAASVITISGFGGDPSFTYLARASIQGGTPVLGANASYSYGAGVASWTFDSPIGFGGTGTDTLNILGP